MGRSKQLGTFLMIGAAVQALIMLIGTMRRSYLVIALPVLAADGPDQRACVLGRLDAGEHRARPRRTGRARVGADGRVGRDRDGAPWRVPHLHGVVLSVRVSARPSAPSENART